MRRMAAMILLAISGCFGAPSSQELESVDAPEGPAPTSSSAPTTPAEQAVIVPSPPPTFGIAGMAWSTCDYFSSAYSFKHEWAEDLVPPQYRKANTQGGNIGQVTLQLYSCAGLTIGNQTFIPGGQVGYLAVLVEPPPSLRHPDSDFYLLDFFTSSELLAMQMGDEGMPAHLAAFQFGENAFAVASDEAAANITVLHRAEAETNETAPGRLHWVSDGKACWVDVERVSTVAGRSESLFAGGWGNPRTISGPLATLAGISSDGKQSGSLYPPICVVTS